MPRIGFVCPDDLEVSFDDCLAPGAVCPMGERCLPKLMLLYLRRQRQWTGKPSVTQCLNGTRLEYLKITCDYYVAPPSLMFALVGTQVHRGLAEVESDVSLAEERFEEDELTGIIDCYEQEPGGKGILTDYKTWGSWRVARALGLVKSWVPDPTGAVYQRSGSDYKKGDPKKVAIFEARPEAVELGDALWQLNAYRLMFERRGFPVDELQIVAIVRDGGTHLAESRGLTETVYRIPVPKLADGEVNAYFAMKGRALVAALTEHRPPPPCTDEERWDGLRCQKYCEVAQFCDVGREEMGKRDA